MSKEKTNITFQDLQNLAVLARSKHYENEFIDVALQWAMAAAAEVLSLRKQMAAANERVKELEAQPEQDLAFREAASLATALFNKHFALLEPYKSGEIVWSLCDSTAGIISQIDNMVSGLVKPEAAQPKQLEPLTDAQINQVFKEWIVANYDTVSLEQGELVWHDARVGAAIGHARAGWFAAFKYLKGKL